MVCGYDLHFGELSLTQSVLSLSVIKVLSGPKSVQASFFVLFVLRVPKDVLPVRRFHSTTKGTKLDLDTFPKTPKQDSMLSEGVRMSSLSFLLSCVFLL